MKTFENGDYKTEHGLDPNTGKYVFRQSVRGSLVLDVSAESKEGAFSAARIITLHELVRRDDLREFGKHESCEGCVFEASLITSDSPSK